MTQNVTIDKIQLQNADLEHAAEYIKMNARWPFPTIPPDVCKGKSVVICGAGPSLQTPDALETIHHVYKQKGQIWGCNAALKWLKNNRKKVTHGVAVDQTEGMLKHWAAGYDVKYLLASTVNPKLVSMLVQKGARRIAFFHNFCGTLGGTVEADLYNSLYAPTILVGEGLNVVNRVLRVADYMGFDRIFVAGADCSLSTKGDFHVGSVKPDALGLEKLFGEGSDELNAVCGFKVRTTADMALSAIDLAKAKRRYGNRLILLGKTFPAAIVGRSDEFYDRIIAWEKPQDS